MQWKETIKEYMTFGKRDRIGVIAVVSLIRIIYALPYLFGKKNEPFPASAFIALPGIGSKLAARIVNFRHKLGGFYSIDQVGETYGLPDSTFQKIKASLQLNVSVKKLKVNTAAKEELKVHPYIKWNLANAIVE